MDEGVTRNADNDPHNEDNGERQRLLHNDAVLSPKPGIEGPNSEEPSSGKRWKVLGVSVTFFVMGMNVAPIGALIPYLEPYYSLDDTLVSLIFLVPLLGYITASALNHTIHARFGQRGISLIGPMCHLIQATILSFHPPFAIVLVGFSISLFGTGLLDAGFCAWAGGLPDPNKIQGILLGSYSLGATAGPFVATWISTKGGLEWYAYYYVMAGAAVVELCLLSCVFRHEDGARFRAVFPKTAVDTDRSHMYAAWRNKVTWICAGYFLAYVGVEFSVSGWIVTFMLRIRSASPYTAGLCSSGFFIGMTLGRLILGFITDHFGERRSITTYLTLSIIFELVIWLVPLIPVSMTAIVLLGFFLGPIFPAGIVMVARLLPTELHVSAIATAAAVGQMGGALSPFAVGAISQHFGVKSFLPIILVLLVLVLGIWLSFPRWKPEHDVGESTADDAEAE